MMRNDTFVILVGVLGLLLLLANIENMVKRSQEEGTTWVLLVAGSKGIENYRHQADIYHAYKIVREGGIDEDQIIVFHFNDIAKHRYNPSPGTVRHVEGGEDLYPRVPWDYTGSDVSSTNVLAVLRGNQKRVGYDKKVILSNSKDRIFVFWSGHGQPDNLHMPTLGDNIHKLKLKKTLLWMRKRNRFKTMVLYIGACFCGCMFEPEYLEDRSIYVVTSTNCTHPSFSSKNSWWGTHSQSWSTQFGRAWIYDSLQHNRLRRSIGEQFDEVKRNLSSSSRVMEYGATELKTEKLFPYQGY